jgi:putative ABC transport system permease protein
MSATALRWMVAGEWRAHPARVAIGALAIAIGVALGFAVHLVNASALTSFDAALRTVTGDADLRVAAAGPAGFDEALYPRLARLGGIAAASPVIEVRGGLGARRTPVTLVGIDVLRAGAVTPGLIGRPAAGDGEALFASDALFLSGAALAASGGRVGDTTDVAAGGRTARLRIAGTLPGVPADQAIGMMDIGAMQWRFGRIGRIDRIDLKLADSVGAARARAAIRALLPADAVIADPESDASSSDSLSRAYRVNLDMLALVALLTGAFLVYSAQSLSVARRATQFALLRVLGAERSMVTRQLVAEGAVLGLIGGGAGLVLGLALAQGALDLAGGDLGGGYFDGQEAHLVFAPGAAALFLGLGLAAALIGSIVPALAGARTPPAVALKNAGDAVDPRKRPSALPALLLIAAGGIAALLPAINDLPLFGYLAIGLLLAGGIAAMPWLARALLTPLAARSFAAAPVDLAVRRLWGAPSQATVALSGIVASTSLMIAMAVMVASFRYSVDQWLGQVLGADVYLRIEGGGGIDPAAQARLRAVPGVAEIAFSRILPLRIAPDRPPVTLVARPNPARGLPMIGAIAAAPPGATPIWLSEPFARLYGRRPGETLTLPIATRTGTRWFVAGIWRDYARQHGAIAIDAATYTSLTGDAGRDEAAVTLAPRAQAGQVMARLRAALPPAARPTATLAEPRQLRRTALALFDRSFAVTYLLEGIAILVGLAGVAATFSAQTIARTREFGMLRHIGVTRGQVTAMLGTEGALLGAVGVAAGIGLGVAMSQVLIQVVNPQSFHWTMETRLPWGLFAGVAAALVTAAAGTAMLAGRRALSFDAVRAAREDM